MYGRGQSACCECLASCGHDAMRFWARAGMDFAPNTPHGGATGGRNVQKTGYLIDMDGVIYRGNELIPGAADFVRQLLDRDTPFLFLTNNRQRTRRDVATKLNRLGI